MKKIKKADKLNKSKEGIKKPPLSEKAKNKLIFEEKVEKIKNSIKAKLDKFSSNHNVMMPCYPNGKRRNTKGEIKSAFYYQHIYICKNICENKCSEFLAKAYICKEIGCMNYPICSLGSVSDRKYTCKRKHLYKERIRLNALYNKYLHYYAIYRGLKTDPVKTYKYLENMKNSKKKESE